LCGLGRTAPNPLLSTLRIFRDEYLAHIRERRCPAGACRALSRQQGSTEEGTRAEAETVDR
ncbi:MAG TPA: NADH-ubiquinone oxidoreductase-F iron-sulfur binding region domain-containing protein, partial [Corynebacterium sp.]|nr:NADH-ubiquinone oxidoreductase-F iron-sulfur binding region domain-containing protein [Corynebacterium sp.]